jgi:hypothetical protein
MGINLNSLRLLLTAKDIGADLSRVATLGRQGLHLQPSQIRQGLSEFGILKSIHECRKMKGEFWADDLFRTMGVEEIESFDNSPYESATHVHDFNAHIPERFHERYSLLMDGGSLEHVYNLPVALENCMQMLKKGGTFIGASPCNNYMGHGFYQLSPELFYRSLSPDRGFVVQHMWLVLSRNDDLWYSVPDPAQAGRRVGVVGARPMQLFVIAKRVAVVPLTGAPQQSEYAEAWKAGVPSLGNRSRLGRFKKMLRRRLPEKFMFIARAILGAAMFPSDFRRFRPGRRMIKPYR